MTSDAATGYRYFCHDAALYGSDEDFLSIVVPFIRDGLAVGEPALVTVGERGQTLLSQAIPDTAHVSFLSGYSQPATTLRAYRAILADHVAEGTGRIRSIGEVPHPGIGAPWTPWARYEAAINRLLADFPLWGVCVYDTRITPAEVLTDVERTHPRFMTAGGRQLVSPRFQDPLAFLAESQSGHIDPLERLAPPTVALVSPSLEAARFVTGGAAARAGLASTDVDDLVLAVSECVTNAIRHGEPPVELRLWSAPGRAVVTVSDRGRGPRNPFAGLLPTYNDRAEGGLGLWIAHQVCAHVGMHRHDDGFTVRLIAGKPVLEPTPAPAPHQRS